MSITRERLLEIIVTGPEASGAEQNELARMALAAMDSESGYLPLDYLQGHKDGLEWAAQLAEANHPETGDWLYDDPIELAKAIRKGPDMPPAQPAADSEPVAFIARYESGAIHGTCDRDDPVKMEWLKRGMDVSPLYAAPQLPQPAVVSEKIIDNFEEEFRRAFEVSAAVEQLIEIGYQGDKFSLSIRDAATLWKLGRAAMLQGGNSPVIPDGWTCNDKANAALMMLDRIETADPVDDDRIDGIKRIVRELAAAPHDTPALNSVQSVVTVPGKWIPVSERMPENDVSVLTFDGMYKRVHHAMYGHWQCWEPEKITHWMPLPAAPQEVSDA
ncbi:TPA: DUF551 domain-containing protein [Klebsiella pneumoniae]|nr:DUF551 domain-containing protein [Klebsiella pneumoniae]